MWSLCHKCSLPKLLPASPSIVKSSKCTYPSRQWCYSSGLTYKPFDRLMLVRETWCGRRFMDDIFKISTLNTVLYSILVFPECPTHHYSYVIMDIMACQITSLIIVYSTAYSGADQGKHQSSASLALLRGTHRWPVNSPHQWPVTRKMFPLDDVNMTIISPHRFSNACPVPNRQKAVT